MNNPFGVGKSAQLAPHFSLVMLLSLATFSNAQYRYQFVDDMIGPDFPVATLNIDELPFSGQSLAVTFLDVPFGEPTVFELANQQTTNTLSEIAPGRIGCTECTGFEFVEYRSVVDSFFIDRDDGAGEQELFLILAVSFNGSGGGEVFADIYGATETFDGEWIAVAPEPTSATLLASLASLWCACVRGQRCRWQAATSGG